jgi:outer membrane murein-binding lipoprotein Lpp
MSRLALVAAAVIGFALAGCSSDREERAKYEERQQLRHQGQSEANRAADSGNRDLNQATQGK